MKGGTYMKKEIENLLRSENGVLSINNMFYLKFNKFNALQKEVNNLTIYLKIVNNHEFSVEPKQIKSRDLAGILLEINIFIDETMNVLKNNLIKSLNGGYLF